MKKLLFLLIPLALFAEDLHYQGSNGTYSGDITAALPDTVVWTTSGGVQKIGFWVTCDSIAGTGTSTTVSAKCRGLAFCGTSDAAMSGNRAPADTPFLQAQFRTGQNTVNDSVDFTDNGLLSWDVPDSLIGSGVNSFSFPAAPCIECIIYASDTMGYRVDFIQK